MTFNLFAQRFSSSWSGLVPGLRDEPPLAPVLRGRPFQLVRVSYLCPDFSLSHYTGIFVSLSKSSAHVTLRLYSRTSRTFLSFPWPTPMVVGLGISPYFRRHRRYRRHLSRFCFP